MTSINRNRAICAVFMLILVLCTVFLPVQGISGVAYAAETSYENTNVLADLRSSTINGQPFDIRNYPFDSNGTVQVIDFVEYCYSFKTNMADNYGLYVYIYNPQGSNLAPSSNLNKIEMAVAYDANGKPTDYEKFNLQFCSKAEQSDYKNLFYKYKVVDRKIRNGTTFFNRVNSNERQYDVSGIELLTYGQSNATEYTVGGSYLFTGYAAGYGPDAKAESTLSCDVKYLETVQLNVRHTFYRTLTSSKGAGYQNQLDTVYFAVPKRFFDNYGTLQRIKAEWYEYKTTDIVVTSNDEFYNKANPYVGVSTGTPGEYGLIDYNESIGISLGQNAGDAGGGLMAAKWGWNLGNGYLHVPTAALYYLFKVGNISEYDPYASISENGGVPSNDLYDYIMAYNKTHDKGFLDAKDGQISADLFTDDIDDYRKLDTEYGKIQKGYSYYDFDADVDLQKLSAWSETNPSFWDNWINWGLWDAMTGDIPEETSKAISPIYIVKSTDLDGDNNTIADRLLMNSSDVNDLKAFYQEAVTVNPLDADDEEKVVVMFRYAASDYYSAPVDIIELNGGFMWSDKHTSGEAYRAWESVFLDFDIIQLSFQKEGDWKVIPVVSSPIDVVNGITPPVDMGEDEEWWKILLGIVLLILLLLLLAPVLPYIIRAIIWVIMLPIRFIRWIVKSCKEGRRQEREQSPAKVKSTKGGKAHAKSKQRNESS